MFDQVEMSDLVESLTVSRHSATKYRRDVRFDCLIGEARELANALCVVTSKDRPGRCQ